MKKMILFLLIIILSLTMTMPVYAEAEMPRLVDDADLLSSSEEVDLLKWLNAVSEKHGMDVVIVTVWGLDGKSPMAYADDFYDYNGYREDGILLLVSMEERDWWMSTCGEGIRAFTDAGLDYMSEQFLPALSDGDYAEAFEIYAELCDEYIQQARTGAPYDNNNMPKEPFPWSRNLLIALVMGVVVALVVVFSMRGQLTSVRRQDTAAAYTRQDSLNVTEHRDRFLYVHRSRVAKPKDNGGGSSTHRASSGRSHGGSGGKF